MSFIHDVMPSQAIPMIPEGITRVRIDPSEVATILDSETRMRELLENTLAMFCNHISKIAIAKQYNMKAGDTPRFSVEWRTQQRTIEYPLTGILGKVSEAGFRIMVDAAVSHARDMIASSQTNGNWQLKSFELSVGKKTRDEMEIDEQGKVTSTSFVSLSGHQNVNIEGTRADTSFTGPRKTTQTVMRAVLTFSDIHGNEDMHYSHGFEASKLETAAKKQSDNMDRLITGLASLVNTGNNTATKNPNQALQVLADQFGVGPDQLLAMIQRGKDSMSAPAPATNTTPSAPGKYDELWDLDMHEWTCPICKTAFGADFTVSRVKNHLSGHVNSGKLPLQDLDSLTDNFKRWRELKKA